VIIPRGSRMRVLAAYAPMVKAEIKWTRILPDRLSPQPDSREASYHYVEKNRILVDATEVVGPIIMLELLRPDSSRQVRTHRVRVPITTRPSATDYSRPDERLGPRAASYT